MVLAAPQVVLTGSSVAVRPPLDGRQQAVVDAAAGIQLVVGPSGSGKTTVLLATLAERMERGWARERSLGLVATQSVARRWRSTLTGWAGREAPRITTPYSLALRIVQQDAQARGAEPPQLLSAGDHLAVMSDVLADAAPEQWPALYREALRTRRFAERVRDFIGRAALAGWTPERLGAAQGPEVWPALASAWRRYRRVLALAGALDYAELVDRATGLAGANGDGAPDLICIDDYADLDPRQAGLLQALVGPGTRLIATSDPDLVVDRFRGAAEHATSEFIDLFPQADAPVILQGSYRFGERVEDARLSLAGPLSTAGLPAAVARGLRTQRRSEQSTGLDVVTYPDAFAEGAGVAAIVRRYATAGIVGSADPPRWSDCAVLVRSAAHLESLEQALVGVGVPVAAEVAGRRLGDEPVVRLLRTALELACQAAGVPAAQPEPAHVMDLAISPLGGADPIELRRLVLVLSRAEIHNSPGHRPQAAGHIIAAALLDPIALSQPDPARHPVVRRLLRLQQRIERAAAQIRAGDGAAEVLWTLWSDTPDGPGRMARQLRAEALRGGAAAAAAHRGLDAALALFAEARRSPARGGRLQVAEFLAALPGLMWPAGRTAQDAGQVRNAVSLLTAHAARGRQWPLVIVAGVQEGSWPGEAGGLGLLGEELLEPGGSARAARESHVATERRLFLLACTRASEQLVVTAVAAAEHDPSGAQPSRFLADLAVTPRPAVPHRDRNLTALEQVAVLRATAVLPDASPALREAAAQRLAALRGDADFPWADPERWWALAERTAGPVPIIAESEPVTLTVTALAELAECPWRWFAGRLLGAARPSDTATGIGRLVHRIHEAWANEEIARDMAAAEEVVDRVWGSIPFEADWHGRRRRAEVMDALVRLLAWQDDNLDRIAFAERPFDIVADLADGTEVRLRGKADVGIREGEQGLAVLDLKTAKSAPTRADVARHVQLAGYQWAVQRGGLDGTDAPRESDSGPAGAALLLASIPDRAGGTHPKVLWQPPLDAADEAGAWFEGTLAAAAGRLRAEEFPAVPSPACRTCPVVHLCPAHAPAAGVAQ